MYGTVFSFGKNNLSNELSQNLHCRRRIKTNHNIYIEM